ncbi:MAG: DNA primase [Alphaproteobacteria bacterium]|nr:DNA primase [Alphaproteobacteria bacterium]
MSDFAPYLEQIRARLRISEVIGKDVRLIRKGNEFSGLCPFHNEKTPSFTINDAKEFYHCFGCGAHGDVISYTMHRHGLNFMDSVKHLADLTGVTLPEKNEKKETVEGVEYFTLLEEACLWYQENLKRSLGGEARTYLEQRGFPQKTIEEFRLGFAPDRGQGFPSLYQTFLTKGFSKKTMLSSGLFIQAEDKKEPYDRFRGRLMFPILDLKGRVVAFGGRTLGDGQPKYLNSSDTSFFHKGQILYNYVNACKHVNKDQPLIVVEGYCDVIALSQAGWKTAVAPLGTALTAEQLHLLWKRNPQPLLCFDGDNAGLRATFRAAERALPLLSSQKTLKFINLPKGEDPDSFLKSNGKPSLQKIFSAPSSLVETLWQSLLFSVKPMENADPEEKAAFKRNALDLIEKIEDSEVKYFYQLDFNERLRNLWYKPFKSREVSKASITQGFLNKRDGLYKKNSLSQKILLATILNHPTLLHEIAEQFAVIEFERKEWEDLKHYLLESLNEDIGDIKLALQTKGFGSILEEILDKSIYVHAPFASEGTDQAVVLERWGELWQRTTHQELMKKDLKSSTEDMKTSFDQKAWEKLKALKANLTPQS